MSTTLSCGAWLTLSYLTNTNTLQPLGIENVNVIDHLITYRKSLSNDSKSVE